MVATCLKKGCAIDRVESVFEVNLEQRFVLVPAVTLKPLARDPYANFGSKGLGNAYLEREKKS